MYYGDLFRAARLRSPEFRKSAVSRLFKADSRVDGSTFFQFRTEDSGCFFRNIPIFSLAIPRPNEYYFHNRRG